MHPQAEGTSRSSRGTLIPFLLRLCVACALVAACAGSAVGTPLEIVAEDFRFSLPETVPAGLVTITLSNSGSQPHAAQLYRLDDGVTVERFTEALEVGIDAERALASAVGGPANVDPGETGSEVSVALEPGTYAVVCWLLDSNRTPHAFLGMVGSFEVTGESEDSVSLPSTEATFELSDYVINLPEDFDGSGSFRVVNRGGEWHELVFAKLNEGFSADQAVGHITGGRITFPAPFLSRGGVSALEVGGGEATIDLDLDDGRYLVFCGVPNSDGVLHAVLGMRAGVTIVPE